MHAECNYLSNETKKLKIGRIDFELPPFFRKKTRNLDDVIN